MQFESRLLSINYKFIKLQPFIRFVDASATTAAFIRMTVHHQVSTRRTVSSHRLLSTTSCYPTFCYQIAALSRHKRTMTTSAERLANSRYKLVSCSS